MNTHGSPYKEMVTPPHSYKYIISILCRLNRQERYYLGTITIS